MLRANGSAASSVLASYRSPGSDVWIELESKLDREELAGNGESSEGIDIGQG